MNIGNIQKKERGYLLAFLTVVMLIISFSFAASAADAAAALPKLSKKKVTLIGLTDNSYTLKVQNPKADSTYEWISQNTNIVSVEAKKSGTSAVVTPLKKGTTTVTCNITYKNKKKRTLSCKFVVQVPCDRDKTKNYISNKKLDSATNQQYIKMGETYTFTRAISPAGCSDKTFWVSDNTNVVTVKKGVITPIAPGTATISMYIGPGAKKAKAQEPLDSIRICVEELEVKVKEINAISVKELRIEFEQAIDESTVVINGILSNNITITPLTSGTVAAATLGKLKASVDGNRLTIVPENSFSGNYRIIISDNVKTTSGKNITAYSEDKDLTDKIKPAYMGTTLDDSGMLAEINFSEPINIDNLMIKSPFRTGNSSSSVGTVTSTLLTNKSNYKLSKDAKSLTIDMSGISTTDYNQSITVSLYGIVDLAGNATNPYPLQVQLWTDTSVKTQANCLSIIRNGNSLVASFDRAIQTPGNILVEGITIAGIVNTENKKEVVFTLPTSLQQSTTLTGIKSVTIYGYSGYNVGTLAGQMILNVDFTNRYAAPTITASELKNDSGLNKLILTFNREIKLSKTSGSDLSATMNTNGLVSTLIPFTYTASAEGNILTLVLQDTVNSAVTYNFTLPSGIALDSYNNYNVAETVSVTLKGNTTNPLPAPTSVQISSTDKRIIYVTFAHLLDETSATNISNYQIDGLTIISAAMAANATGSPAVVKLTLSTAAEEAPYPITISNIVGYNGSYGAMETWRYTVNFSSSQTLEISSVSRSSDKSAIIFTFPSAINASSVVNYAITERIGANSKIHKIKKTVIENNTITIYLEENLTDGSTVLMTPGTTNHIISVDSKVLLNIPTYY